VLDLLQRRGIAFRSLSQSRWISGLMRRIRKGSREQVIDHLICMALIEGRSCEKFQQLRDALVERDPELSRFYGGLVESEGNHYATFWLMAREIDEAEADRRLDFYLDLDAELIVQPSLEPRLH
jgi:tRNA-(ms[2]io[6]A)-hydroxylase